MKKVPIAKLLVLLLLAGICAKVFLCGAVFYYLTNGNWCWIIPAVVVMLVLELILLCVKFSKYHGYVQ